MPNTYFITTAIPFVNGNPHIGHALEFVQADTLSRQLRSQGHRVLFQSGTDDNAFKNVLAAREEGRDAYDFIHEKAEVFKSLQEKLGVEADIFIQTSSIAHKKGVQKLWRSLDTNDLYQKEYTGQYCNGCEDFVDSDSLVEGGCPEHPAGSVSLVAEKNWFFRLSAYQEQLERIIEDDTLLIKPATRKNEVLSFIRNGLEDICISRNADRAPGWGTQVPGDESQTVYVWIDALINYLTGPGYGINDNWKEWWNTKSRKIHVIGKNVWKFHAVYWPALLLSAGLCLPDELRIHGFITNDGQKISKSLGNGIDLNVLVEKYSAAALRFYLLDQIPSFKDGDFNEERLFQIYSKKLAGGIGNLLNRLLTLSQKLYIPIPNLACKSVIPAISSEGGFDKQLTSLFSEFSCINQRLSDEAPWSASAAIAEKCVSQCLLDLSGILKKLDDYLPWTYRKALDLIWDYSSGQGVGKLFPSIVKPIFSH